MLPNNERLALAAGAWLHRLEVPLWAVAGAAANRAADEIASTPDATNARTMFKSPECRWSSKYAYI